MRKQKGNFAKKIANALNAKNHLHQNFQASSPMTIFQGDLVIVISTSLNDLLRFGKKEDFMKEIWQEMYEAAKKVLNPRQISEYVSAGEVSAAILSASGKIYTGVCVDTCSTLGICAERNAIFNMISNGESRIKKVLCIPPFEGKVAPCGACRELLVQIMPDSYKEIEIMLDFKSGRIATLGELTPEWWISY